MSEAVFDDSSRPTDPVGRTLDAISRLFAICSGLMLVAMALMSVYSILGRSFFDSPLLGDYELVQMMSAVAVSMALPFCQMVNGHVIVDFFTTRNSARTNARLDVIAAVLLAICSFAIAWRVVLATVEFRSNHDATMLLSLPTWWGYAPMGPSFFLLGCAALYTAWKNAKAST
ncbi:MAG: TRAP transporter small permease [Gammaproteobacteria bacterium]|nr:TRAP transporter small permease [Gammaproteobacteria bacterium]MBU1439680.1 TRAP transporter small permease [Gammaproteobacteria bacterium]MBU2288792.1 TRAP transporter small permease [Gammaproteobacteria bacterium]